MLQSLEQKRLTIFSQALIKYKSRLKQVFLYSFISNILFLIFALYPTQVIDRVIGSGNIDTTLMLSVIVGVTLLCWFIFILVVQILLYRNIKKDNEWIDSKISLFTNDESVSMDGRALIKLNLFLGPSISIVADTICCILYLLILFLIHPYIGIAAIMGSILVVGFAYIKMITTNKALRGIIDFNIENIKWYYLVQQISELLILVVPIPTIAFFILNIGYSWFKFHIMSIALKQSNKPYKNGNLSKFYRFLKALLTINIKIISCMLITGVSAYLVVSTNGIEVTTGGLIASSIIMARISIAADNIVAIWPNMRNSYIFYSNLRKSVIDQNFVP